jgi:hypothetical protein
MDQQKAPKANNRIHVSQPASLLPYTTTAMDTSLLYSNGAAGGWTRVAGIFQRNWRVTYLVGSLLPLVAVSI